MQRTRNDHEGRFRPSLLHQAAMDALRQWKYQPASLDGKLVPMHLAVTIQFHLQ